MWTQFMDMHSGGGLKEPPYGYIYIEAPEEEARVIFYNRFGHNPERVSCTCCGEDYSITESKTLKEATAYERGCDYAWFRPDGTECDKDEAWISGKGTNKGYESRYVERPSKTPFSWQTFCTLEEYKKKKTVLIIPASKIKDKERKGSVPEQGYVWKD